MSFRKFGTGEVLPADQQDQNETVRQAQVGEPQDETWERADEEPFPQTDQ